MEKSLLGETKVTSFTAGDARTEPPTIIRMIDQFDPAPRYHTVRQIDELPILDCDGAGTKEMRGPTTNAGTRAWCN
jgi:hypothetical protein